MDSRQADQTRWLLAGMEKDRTETQARLDFLNKEISSLRGQAMTGSRSSAPKPKGTRQPMSQERKDNMSRAAKARWAARREAEHREPVQA